MPVGSKNIAKLLRVFLFVADRVSDNSAITLKPKIKVSSISSHKNPKIFSGLIPFCAVSEMSFLELASFVLHFLRLK